MRIFVFEYFSGGGLAGEPLPPDIAHEGELILGALLEELGQIPGIDVMTSRDSRLRPLMLDNAITPRAGEDALALYRRGLEAADCGWPTAPETGGMLERLARETLASGKRLLGCAPEAICLTASKRTTAHVLRQAGIPVVPTFGFEDPLPPLPGPWITKPDDGAGSEGAELVLDWVGARELLAAHPDHIAQPWIDGQQLSLSLVCSDGVARLLSCNRQQVRVEGGRLSLEAILVNAFSDQGELARLAGRLAETIPGLWGYVGVDLIMTDRGPTILEINPRLTTSYCGLGRALGINTAELVIGLLGPATGTEDRPPAIPGIPVEVVLGVPSAS